MRGLVGMPHVRQTGRLYRNGRVLERETGEDGGVRLEVSLSAQALGQFEQMFPDAQVRAH